MRLPHGCRNQPRIRRNTCSDECFETGTYRDACPGEQIVTTQIILKSSKQLRSDKTQHNTDKTRAKQQNALYLVNLADPSPETVRSRKTPFSRGRPKFSRTAQNFAASVIPPSLQRITARINAATSRRDSHTTRSACHKNSLDHRFVH